MNDQLHPNHPDFVRNDAKTGEIDDGEVLDGEVLEPLSTGIVAALQRAEIDGQVATAKAYPRSLTEVHATLKALVTLNEESAAECVYALPRGQKKIRGASAYFADALISVYGNARSESFVSAVNFEEMWVEAIGAFQDVERNVIRKRRTRRGIRSQAGTIYNADMINMTGNAACRIAERNAILNGIPKPLWSPAYDAAFALVAGTIQTLEAKRDRAFAAFNVMGIAPELVLEKLGRQDLSKVVLDDIVTLRGMLTALKSGEETIDTIFGRGAASNHEKTKNPLQDDPKMVGAEQQTESGAKSPANPPGTQGNGGGEHSKEASVNPTPAGGAAQAHVEEGSKAPAADVQPAGNNAQASPAGPAAAEKSYTDAESYMGFVRDRLDTATSKAAVTDLWGSTRADRNELLSPEQIDVLTRDKEAKLKALKLKEPK